jgi:uncharacterized protein (DUF169 family)
VISKDDLEILEKFGLEIEPVAIKYMTGVPPEVSPLNGKMTLCEMLRKAQHGDSFYAGPENHTCDAGPYILGQVEIKEQFINGEWGAGLGVFLDPRAASRLYHYIPRIARNVVRYITLAPVSKLNFHSDVLVVFVRTSQAEIMLRAMSYKTGQMWSSKYSSAIGCAWMFVYCGVQIFDSVCLFTGCTPTIEELPTLFQHLTQFHYYHGSNEPNSNIHKL